MQSFIFNDVFCICDTLSFKSCGCSVCMDCPLSFNIAHVMSPCHHVVHIAYSAIDTL